MPENGTALVMFSGGKDSFLTACRLVEQGKRVTLLSFNNGAVAAEEHILHGASRLGNRYGNRIEYAGVYPTVGTLRLIDEHWASLPWSRLGAEYPDLSNAQVNCLHCQSAMWIAAIAYCVSKSIGTIATGYKSCDPFCTGMPAWNRRMRTTAERHGVSVETPLWTTPEWGEFPDVGRDREMEHHMFGPSVLEPQCTIGRPVPPPTDAVERQIAQFFDDHIEPYVDRQIDELSNIFRHIRLSAKSLEPYDYAVPDGSHGLY